MPWLTNQQKADAAAASRENPKKPRQRARLRESQRMQKTRPIGKHLQRLSNPVATARSIRTALTWARGSGGMRFSKTKSSDAAIAVSFSMGARCAATRISGAVQQVMWGLSKGTHLMSPLRRTFLFQMMSHPSFPKQNARRRTRRPRTTVQHRSRKSERFGEHIQVSQINSVGMSWWFHSWSLSKSTSPKWYPCMHSKKYTPTHPHPTHMTSLQGMVHHDALQQLSAFLASADGIWVRHPQVMSFWQGNPCPICGVLAAECATYGIAPIWSS